MNKPLFFTAMVISLILLVGLGGPASAHPSDCTTNPVDGSVKCVHDDSVHGGDDDDGSPGSSQTEEDRWNAFLCNLTVAYQPGYMVDLTTLNQIPPENYDTINADPSAPGYRFLEDGIEYFNVLVHCDYPGGPAGGTIRIFSGPELGVAGPDPFALRAEALAQVVLPTLQLGSNPPHSTPDRFGVVRIPTWFWMESSNFDPITETATDDAGTMTVSVTATPQVANWNPGDGSTPVPCTDAGVEWVSGLPETATTCFHTYTFPSVDAPGDKYTVEVIMDWEYTWSIDGAPQGPFGGTTLTDSFPYAVGEIQAVGT